MTVLVWCWQLFSLRILGSFDTESTELIALCEGLTLTRSWGIQVDVAEIDALNIVHCLKSEASCSHNALIYLHVKPLLDSVINCKAYNFLPHMGNRIAHSLKHAVYSLSNGIFWVDSSPLFITSLILDDRPNKITIFQKKKKNHEILQVATL